MSENLLLDLKILSSLKKGQKIYRTYRTESNKISIHEENELLVPIKRFIFFQSRTTMIEDITEIVNHSINTIDNLINILLNKELKLLTTKDIVVYNEDISNLLKELENSLKGIENLKYTYSGDNIICCKLDILYNKIINYLKNNSSKMIELSLV